MTGINDESTDSDEDFDLHNDIIPCQSRWTQSYEVKMENDHKTDNTDSYSVVICNIRILYILLLSISIDLPNVILSATHHCD